MQYRILSLGAIITAVTLLFGNSGEVRAQNTERLVTSTNTTRVYAVAPNGTKRWLQNPRILQSYGYSFAAVEVISPQALQQIPDTKAIRLNNQPGVYILTQELTKRGVGSPNALRAAGLSLRDVVSVNQMQFNSYSTGRFITADSVPPTPTTEANLLKTATSPRVYGIAPNGTKRWFRTPAVLRSYGFSFAQVRTVAPPTITNTPNTKAIRLQGQPGVYRLNPDWTKQGIASPQVLRSLGLSFADVVVVNQTEFNSYPTGPFITSAPTGGAPEQWNTYRSEALDFSIEYPPNMTSNRTQQDTVKFQLFGPTQERATEVTDGISLTIRRESLQGMSLREYAQSQTESPVIDRVVEPVHRVTINGIGGYAMTVESLGVITHIFLPSLEGATFHISYVAPDPGNRGYQDIVNRILSTFSRLSR